jgi:Ala-tRNA(Pro) deacylase
MAIAASNSDSLKRERVPYRMIAHAVAYTAQEAAVAHVPGRHWAKTVICMADDQPIQVVVPADMMVDLERLRELARARVVRLGTEDEIARLIPSASVEPCPRSAHRTASESMSTRRWSRNPKCVQRGHPR